MNVDLHCHSNISDGTLAPAVVAARAKAKQERDEKARIAAGGAPAQGTTNITINASTTEAKALAKAVYEEKRAAEMRAAAAATRGAP